MFDIPQYSVSEFSRSIKRVVEDAFGYVRIKGEVSGSKLASSGHLYFNLKDQNSVISAACFRGHARLIDFEVADGLEVVASGKVTTYEGRSNYQIIVEKLEISGVGTLMEAIERLRKKLIAEGLFEDRHKKQIPFWSKSIGIITSKTGSVIEDMKHRILERCPGHIVLYHAAMQGANCANEVMSGIEYLNNSNLGVEVIIIARGGGSFEDLLPFNQENLARAVFNSKIPIVSAIGHETDTSIIDYVSDLRAPTPTAAAEMVTPSLLDLKARLLSLSSNLHKALKSSIDERVDQLSKISKYIIDPHSFHEQIFRDFRRLEEGFTFLIGNIFTDKLNRLKSNIISKRLLIDKVDSQFDNLKHLNSRLSSLVGQQLNLGQNNLDNLTKILESSSYKNTLSRGFALIKDMKGDVVDSVSAGKKSKQLNIEVADGGFKVKPII